MKIKLNERELKNLIKKIVKEEIESANKAFDFDEVVENIKQIAKDNPDGFTIKLEPNGEITYPNKGWCVGIAETQNSFGEEGIRRVIPIAMRKTNGVIGGWLNGSDYYFDATMIIHDKEKAINFGKENGQIGIFNLEDGEYIEF